MKHIGVCFVIGMGDVFSVVRSLTTLKVVTIPVFGCEQGLATPFLFVDDAPTNHWIVGISKQTYEEGIVATLAFRHAVDSKKGFRPGGSR